MGQEGNKGFAEGSDIFALPEQPQTDSDLLNDFFSFELPKMDKVLTLDQLIQAKLDSGELIKNCK